MTEHNHAGPASYSRYAKGCHHEDCCAAGRAYAREQAQVRRWMTEAACIGIDPDLFFPERGGDTTAAKRVCRACPVRLLCLDYGLDERDGIWGGLSGRERRALRRHRRAVA